MLRLLMMMAAAGVAAPACGAPLKADADPSNSSYKGAAARPEKPVSDQKIPLNQRFASLDEYLAYLKKRGAVDMAWWREVRPGIYERVSSFRPAEGRTPERATRAQLMERYGFTR